MEAKIVIASLIMGYIVAGWMGLMKVSSASMIDKPMMMARPNIFKKIYWILCWPIHQFIEAYYAQMPNKARAVVYATITVPIMWLGFSVFGYLLILPHLLIESELLAMLGSVVCFFIGGVVLAPIIGMVCAATTIIIAAPIVFFLPSIQAMKTYNQASQTVPLRSTGRAKARLCLRRYNFLGIKV